MGTFRTAVLGICLTTSTAAMADPTMLICDAKDQAFFQQDEATTIELNEANSTVSVHFSGLHLRNPGGITGGQDGMGGQNAHSIGPIRAQFGSDTITFPDPRPDPYLTGYVINRLTGDFQDVPGSKWVQYTCHAAQKKF